MSKQCVLGLLFNVFLLLNVNAQVRQDNGSNLPSLPEVSQNDHYYHYSVQLKDLGSLKGAQEVEHYEGSNFVEMSKEVDPGKILKATETLIAIGEKIYEIVKKGEPVQTTSYEPVSVLPSSLRNEKYPGLVMENWKGPSGRRYEIVVKNLYGMKVIQLTFIVLWNYGGTYEGTGKYISALQIVPESVSTAWGYTFNVSSVVDNIFNYGTKENPVAAVRVRINYQIGTILKKSEDNMVFVVDGIGGFKKF